MAYLTAGKADGVLAYAINIGGRHDLLTDEPNSDGGDDLGPTPHELFDASLAACTSLTVTLYARRKQWPLRDIRIGLTRDDSDESKGEYRLKLEIELVGELDETQRARLMEIAGRCPIHRLMEHGHIHITIEPAASPG